MRFLIKHEVQGRLRIHVIRNRMTCAEADVLCWVLEKQKNVVKVKVYERTADAVIYYTGDREELIHGLKQFHLPGYLIYDICLTLAMVRIFYHCLFFIVIIILFFVIFFCRRGFVGKTDRG